MAINTLVQAKEHAEFVTVTLNWQPLLKEDSIKHKIIERLRFLCHEERLKINSMINWQKEDDGYFRVVSEASDLVTLENELTETIVKILELRLFKKKFVEFYSDATNGSFFINELDENKERTDNSKTVHFCALKIWEDYENANEFDSDIKATLYSSIEKLRTRKKVKMLFKIIVRDELGDEEEI